MKTEFYTVYAILHEKATEKSDIFWIFPVYAAVSVNHYFAFK